MLFLEQARGRPGARGHYVGDPWCMESAMGGRNLFQSRGHKCTTKKL